MNVSSISDQEVHILNMAFEEIWCYTRILGGIAPSSSVEPPLTISVVVERSDHHCGEDLVSIGCCLSVGANYLPGSQHRVG